MIGKELPVARHGILNPIKNLDNPKLVKTYSGTSIVDNVVNHIEQTAVEFSNTNNSDAKSVSKVDNITTKLSNSITNQNSTTATVATIEQQLMLNGIDQNTEFAVKNSSGIHKMGLKAMLTCCNSYSSKPQNIMLNGVSITEFILEISHEIKSNAIEIAEIFNIEQDQNQQLIDKLKQHGVCESIINDIKIDNRVINLILEDGISNSNIVIRHKLLDSYMVVYNQQISRVATKDLFVSMVADFDYFTNVKIYLDNGANVTNKIQQKVLSKLEQEIFPENFTKAVTIKIMPNHPTNDLAIMLDEELNNLHLLQPLSHTEKLLKQTHIIERIYAKLSETKTITNSEAQQLLNITNEIIPYLKFHEAKYRDYSYIIINTIAKQFKAEISASFVKSIINSKGNEQLLQFNFDPNTVAPQNNYLLLIKNLVQANDNNYYQLIIRVFAEITKHLPTKSHVTAETALFFADYITNIIKDIAPTDRKEILDDIFNNAKISQKFKGFLAFKLVKLNIASKNIFLELATNKEKLLTCFKDENTIIANKMHKISTTIKEINPEVKILHVMFNRDFEVYTHCTSICLFLNP